MIRLARAVVLIALLGAGCSNQGRSLLPLDISVAPNVGPIASVEVVVTVGAENRVATKSLPWNGAAQPLQVGIYVPADVDGAVTVQVIAHDGNGSRVGVSPRQPATVHPGQTSPTVNVRIERLPGLPDGGSDPDGGGQPGDAAAIDAVASDASSPDVVSQDQASSEGGGPEPDGGAGSDVALRDGGAAMMDADASPPAPDAPLDSGFSWSAAENLEHDVIDRSFWPAVAIDGKGNTLVVWNEKSALKSKRYDAVTRTWGDTKTIENKGSILAPNVKMGANGHAIAIWTQYPPQVPEADAGVWASSSKDGGVTWSTPRQVHKGPAYYDVELQVSREGHARAAWTEAMSNIDTLWSASYDDAADTWSNVGPVKVATDGASREPKLVLDAKGGGMLVWHQPDETMNSSTWACTFGPNQPLSEPKLLDTLVTDYTFGSAVAIMADGSKGIAIWAEHGATENVMASEYLPASGGWQAPTKIISTSQWVSSMVPVIDQNATVTIAWTQPLATGKSNVVAIRRLDGQAWGPVTPLETTNQAGQRTDEDPNPVIGVDGAGVVHVAWARRMSAMDTATYGVFTTRFAMGKWQPEQMIALKQGIRAMDPGLAVGPDGHAAIAFYYGDPKGTQDADAFNAFAALFR